MGRSCTSMRFVRRRAIRSWPSCSSRKRLRDAVLLTLLSIRIAAEAADTLIVAHMISEAWTDLAIDSVHRSDALIGGAGVIVPSSRTRPRQN